jgi:hypothetical protein
MVIGYRWPNAGAAAGRKPDPPEAVSHIYGACDILGTQRSMHLLMCACQNMDRTAAAPGDRRRWFAVLDFHMKVCGMS